MVYNQINYNQILYNSTRRRFGALARSIISAHTGPHIQAVVGGSPDSNGGVGGLSFISDFIIRQEGTKSPPPTAFNFPDLSAFIQGFIRQTDDLPVFIRAQQIKDLPAKIFIVDRFPDLSGRINSLIFIDLGAGIFGMLAEANLAARLQGTEFVNFPAKILGIESPSLHAFIGTHSPANLGAIIWAPANLRARIRVFQNSDLPASVHGFTAKDLAGLVTPIPGSNLRSFLQVLQTGTRDLPARAFASTTAPDISATITVVDHLLGGSITPSGGFQNLPSILTPQVSSQSNLGALIQQLSPSDLSAIIDFLAAKSLRASIVGFSSGSHDHFLPAFLQAVNSSDLSAFLNVFGGLSDLRAIIQSTSMLSDLGAIIRVDETFITTILTITTLMAKDLRASIGNPDCLGGSASSNLPAFARVQHAANLRAQIQTFIPADLRASINSNKIFHAFDTIDVFFSRRNTKTKKFRATDTLTVSYSPFRGKTLAATIVADPPSAILRASITATFPLVRVSPFVSRLTAADLHREDLNIQEVRLEMEGSLNEFLYVNGTDEAFILDANQQWRINIQSFIPIAENLFGDFAAARLCRLGSLEGYFTLDEAVRACIAAVLGLTGQVNLSAFIRPTGFFTSLRARVGVVNHFSNLSASLHRVFPFDLDASIVPTGGFEDLTCLLTIVGSSISDLSAEIDSNNENFLPATITPV